MSNLHRSFFPVVTMLLLPMMPAQAEEGELQHPIVLDNGIVKEILKSDMIMLGNDRRYRLENILVPPYEDVPAMDELKRALLNNHVTIYSYHEAGGKQGIPLVQVITDKNLWVQEDLVGKGLAWAYSTDTSQQMAHTLKLVEDGARLQRLGFWKNPAYAIKTPQTVKKCMESYQIVEGKILSVNDKNGTGATFLNFGKDWKTDFEVRITGDNRFMSLVKDPKAKAAKNKKGRTREDDELDARTDVTEVVFDPLQWQNRIVRVRGWVHGTSAPIIDVTEKEQIDFVDGK